MPLCNGNHAVVVPESIVRSAVCCVVIISEEDASIGDPNTVKTVQFGLIMSEYVWWTLLLFSLMAALLTRLQGSTLKSRLPHLAMTPGLSNKQ